MFNSTRKCKNTKGAEETISTLLFRLLYISELYSLNVNQGLSEINRNLVHKIEKLECCSKNGSINNFDLLLEDKNETQLK